MGVPKFYRWISERYPCLSEVVREYQIPEFDNLYLDMNGIIHNCSHPNDEDVHFRISEEKIFQDIFRYIEFLFRMIKPRKVFFMAIDGVAPRAKMNQQRGRRFRSAKEAETREAEAKQKGEKLPEEARFDSNCITPGTEFMDRLHQHLKYFVTNKLTNDDLWRDVKVVLSGHETPGEGEHKIMDFIRHEKSQPNYDPNTRHCLYGLDADLIMLGMCSHEPHFSLLREEVKYIRSKNDKKNQRDVNPEAITFHLLHLSLFREYIDHEFSELKTTLSFPYNLENIIDDWVLMGFLVGNDFIPHIPHFHINKSSLLKLYSVYKKVLPTLDGYLNENGFLNLHRFQKYLNELSNIDIDNFNDINPDLKYFESKTGRKLFRRELEDTSAFFETNIENNGSNVSNVCDLIPQKEVIDLRSDSEDNEDYHSEEVFDSSDSEKSIFMEEFKSHKRDYYMSKLNYSHVNEAVLKEQAHQYIRAIQWNLHYYYNGCMSWGWFYPHHYAPYISDVNDFSDIDLNFEMGEPFKPFEQLLAVLPSASKALLPKAFEDLVTNSSSPLIDYYPEDFETDQNEKQQTWEAVVLIPFIDEKRLLEAVKKLENNLTKDEMRRNTHGPHLIFTYSEKTVEPMVSPNPSIMPNITVNHAKCETLDPDAFRLPINRIHKGLCDGVKLDVYFPGFPTLRHIPHEAVLKKERVRVFESASLGENMILIIQSRELYDIEYVVNNYLGKSIFVNWPHLVEAKVFQVSNADLKYFIGRNGKVSNEDIEDKEFQEISIRIKSITKKYKERWGVIVGEPQIILHVHPLTGRKYVHGIKGKVTLEKQWSIVPMLCPIQTVVKDIAIFDQSFQQYKTVDQIYPKGAKCFLIDNPYYGAMAKVIDYLSADGLVKVEVFPQLEPDLSEVRDRAKEIVHEKYMPNYFLAQRLGISGHLLSRITGTIFIKPTNSDQRKINIGLNLKFNAKNEEIPGYSIKRDDTWLFSDKIFKIMEEYLTKFPFLFEKLSTVVDKDVFSIDDLIPGEQKQKTLEEIQNWLKSLPSASEKHQKCNAEILDEFVVDAIEDVVNSHLVFTEEIPSVERNCKPNQLFRPIHYLGYSLPDPKANYRLFDRVVNIRSGISVPLGAKGTIIGKHVDETKEVNTLFDIVFDEEFVGGMQLRCSPGKGYKLSPACLINITYGLKLSGKYEQFVSSIGQPLQNRSFQGLNSHRQKLNNSQFSSKDQNYGKFQNCGNFTFGQRMPRPRLPNMTFSNSNIPYSQTSISMQALNHSSTSPFRSPKHGSESTQMDDTNFPVMENIWNNLSRLNIKSNESTNLSTSPKASFAEITASKRTPERPKSNPKARNQKQDNRRSEKVSNSAQNKSHNSVELYESFRNILSKTCLRCFNTEPRFEITTFGPMKSKSIKVSLPDGHSFHTAINCHPTVDDAYDSVSRDALEHLNKNFGYNINLERPNRLLPSPSFIDPKQSSPNRLKIATSALPRPPSVWINKKVQKRSENLIDSIPESFVEENNRLLRELQKSEQSMRTNASIHSNKERVIQPKKLFDAKSDNPIDPSTSQRMTQTRKFDNEMNRDNSYNNNQSQRRYNPNSNNQTAFPNQFVPLQVARNNQSHRYQTRVSPEPNPQLREQVLNEKKVTPETISVSSSDIEILSPEVLIQYSNTSESKDKSSDEIEILTPESLKLSSNPSSGSKSNKTRRSSRMGVNLN